MWDAATEDSETNPSTISTPSIVHWLVNSRISTDQYIDWFCDVVGKSRKQNHSKTITRVLQSLLMVSRNGTLLTFPLTSPMNASPDHMLHHRMSLQQHGFQLTCYHLDFASTLWLWQREMLQHLLGISLMVCLIPRKTVFLLSIGAILLQASGISFAVCEKVTSAAVDVRVSVLLAVFNKLLLGVWTHLPMGHTLDLITTVSHSLMNFGIHSVQQINRAMCKCFESNRNQTLLKWSCRVPWGTLNPTADHDSNIIALRSANTSAQQV